MSSTIAIQYRLFTTGPGSTAANPVFVEVTTPADRELAYQLASADPDQRVPSIGTVAGQNDALHAHVRAVPFDLPVLGYTIDLDRMEESIWDRELRIWVKPGIGGAIYYAVDKPGDAERLFLSVSTLGAAPLSAAGASAAR